MSRARLTLIAVAFTVCIVVPSVVHAAIIPVDIYPPWWPANPSPFYGYAFAGSGSCFDGFSELYGPPLSLGAWCGSDVLEPDALGLGELDGGGFVSSTGAEYAGSPGVQNGGSGWLTASAPVPGGYYIPWGWRLFSSSVHLNDPISVHIRRLCVIVSNRDVVFER